MYIYIYVYILYIYVYICDIYIYIRRPASAEGLGWVVNVNSIITLKQTACRCPTVGAAAPAAHWGRRAGA